MNINLITAIANDCRGTEDGLKYKTKKLNELTIKELTPIIGREIEVSYYATDGYAAKHGQTVQEFVGTLDSFCPNGSLHIVDHKKGVYQNIRPIRIINIETL